MDECEVTALQERGAAGHPHPQPCRRFLQTSEETDQKWISHSERAMAGLFTHGLQSWRPRWTPHVSPLGFTSLLSLWLVLFLRNSLSLELTVRGSNS